MSLQSRSMTLAKLVLAELKAEGVTGSDVVFAPLSDPVPFQLQASPIHPVGLVGGQSPSLMTEAGLFRLPSTDHLWSLYTEGLLLADPENHLDRYNGRQGLAKPFGLAHWSPLVFSVPEAGDLLAGATFALEMATVLRSLGLGRMLSGPGTHAIRMPDEHVYGIVDGLPSFNSQHWKTNIGKHLQAHLSAPRGRQYDARGFNIIDRLTYWLYGHSDIITDTESCLAALTPLRLTGTPLQMHDYEQDLMAIKPGIPGYVEPVVPSAAKIELLDQAIRTFDGWLTDDRQKMMEIYTLLVPAVCGHAHFVRRIADVEAMPSMMTPKALARAKTAVEKLYSIGTP